MGLLRILPWQTNNTDCAKDNPFGRRLRVSFNARFIAIQTYMRRARVARVRLRRRKRTSDSGIKGMTTRFNAQRAKARNAVRVSCAPGRGSRTDQSKSFVGGKQSYAKDANSRPMPHTVRRSPSEGPTRNTR